MSRTVLLCLVASCGRIEFEPNVAIDGAVDDAGGPCGASALHLDHFDVGGASAQWTVHQDPGIVVDDASGSLAIAFASSVSAGSYGYARLAARSGVQCAVAEVATTPYLGTASAIMYVRLRTDVEAIELHECFGSLDARIIANGSTTIVGRVPWDPVAGRFMRLRSDATTSYWETSADGIAYSTIASMAASTTAAYQLELGAGAVDDVANGGTARFASAIVTGP
jgi:hypothetical protein